MVKFYKNVLQNGLKDTIKKHACFLMVLLFVSAHTQAQIAVTANQTAAQLVQKLVGSGVTVSNPSLTCPSVANGVFSTSSSNLGLKGGIVLTSGSAANAVGSASIGASTSNGAAGDADLTSLISATTRDACVLQFDFVPTGDTVKFRYVFGSEEYPGYACTSFNDVFAFYISGPGYSTTKNIALIPNTTIPVAINSTSGVVGYSGGNITVCNSMGSGSPFTQYYINNTSGTTVRYDGFTSIFSAIATVIPCNTYHLKLAIADAIDYAFDSGVFLEEGSLTSNELEISTRSNIQTPVPYCVRGCKNGTFKFKRKKISSYPLTVKYLIGGTAVNGTDYTTIPDSVVIPANDSEVIRTIVPLTTATGSKTVKLYVYSPFSCSAPIIIDSSEIAIFDSLYAQIATPDTAYCPGTPAHIITIGDDALSYSWTPSAGLNGPTDRSPFASPATATTYYLTATLPNSTCAPIHDNIHIDANQATAITTEPQDKTICAGNNTSFPLTATGTNLVYQWQVSTGGNFTNISNNSTYSGAATNTLSLSSVPASMSGYKYRCIISGACTPKDTSVQVTLTVNTPPSVDVKPVNRTVCEGGTTTFSLVASGSSLVYQWQVDDGHGFINVTNGGIYSGATTATLTLTGVPLYFNGLHYQCLVSGVCPSSQVTNVVILTVDTALAISSQPVNKTICTGGSTSFSVTAVGTGINYQWQVSSGSGFANLSSGGIYGGVNTPTLTITNATTAVNGYKYRCYLSGSCPDLLSDSAILNVGTPPAITSPPSATPICDGGTTIFSVGATGTNLHYQWQVNTGSGYTNITNGGVYSGATTASLVITGVSASMSGYQYQCVISGDCPPSVTSGSLTLILTVYTLPSVTQQPSDTTTCEGSDASITVGAAGTGISYEWYVDTGTGYVVINNSGVYSGANTATLHITGATKNMSGYRYVCRVPGTCLPDALSDPAYLHVDTIPVVQNGPLDTTTCDGNAVSFAVDAVGTAKTYQWQENTGLGFINLPNTGIYGGVNSAILHISPVSPAMDGYQYRCVVNGNCSPPATSLYGILHVKSLPAVVTSPADSTICYGGDASFGITAAGTGISYQWQEDAGAGFTVLTDNGMYSGSSTPVLLITGATPQMSGNKYRCIVSGDCTPAATSGAAVLTVNTAPDITLQPHDSLVCEQSNVSFAIQATGTALNYQWQVDAGSGYTDISNVTPYSGANTNTLVITGVPASLHNNSYRCIVSGTCMPPDTSAGAILHVNLLPVITSQPHDSTICAGNNASFGMTGGGTNIGYQWQVNTGGGFINISDGSIYSGTQTNILLISAGTASMDGYKYRCVLTGDCTPPATTNEATLTVHTAPVIVTSLHDSTICEGGNATFSVVANGTALTYSWLADVGPGFGYISDNGVYSGTHTNTLLLTAPPASMSGYRFKCSIYGACPPGITTNTATITIHTLPAITSQPHDSMVCEGESAAFFTTAMGTAISYQWQVNTGGGFVNVSDNAVYSGSQTNVLQLNVPPASMNGYIYRCIVPGTCTPPAVTNPVVLTVNSLPAIILHPHDSIICEGNNTAFIMQATGTNLIYRWQVNDGGGYTDVADGAIYTGAATNNLLLTAPPHSMSGYKYRCILSGVCPPIDTTTEAILTIYELPVITAQPVDKIVCEGDDTYFAAPATGTNITYRWEVNTGSGFTALNDGGVYTGTHTDTLIITGSQAGMDGYLYWCFVSGNCPPAQYSNQVLLTVHTLPLITQQPHDTTICTGNNAAFAIAATGTGIGYQWQVDDGSGFVNVADGGVYSGAATPVLDITNGTTVLNNFRYRCIIAGACQPDAVSDTVHLYISTPPAIVSPPSSTPICDGGTTIFTVGATGTNLHYQWQVNTGGGYVNITNNSIYSGANSASLVITGVTSSMSGYQYQCIIDGDCPPSVTSGSLTLVLTVYTLPAITSQPVNSVTICEGDNTSFNISATGTGIGYQWQVDTGTGYVALNNMGVYSGVNTPTLHITSATHDMSGYKYRCVVPGTCLPDAISNTVNLTVDTIPVVQNGPVDTTVCDGDPASFTVDAIGTGRTYQWQLNNGVGFTNVPNAGIYSGAHTPTLYIASATAAMEGYQYRCVITGTCAPAATSPAGILHIKLLPNIVMPPANTVVCDGGTALFDVVASGTGLTYRWEEDAGSGFVALADNAMYNGTATPNLSVDGVIPSMNGYKYRCVVSGECPPQAISVYAVLTVNTLPDITGNPHDSLLCDGGSAAFSVNATGTALTYQWQADAGSGYTNLTNNSIYSGTTASTLLITGGTASMHNYSYRCIVSGACTPPDTSLSALLKVNTLPAVTLQPHDSTICDGGDAAFIVNGTGTGVTYQWQVNSGSGFVNLVNAGVYTGATTNTLQVTGAPALMNGYRYRCVLSGDCTPDAISSDAVLTVNTPPAIVTQPHDSTICDGGNAAFTLAATGTALTYQWQVNTGSGFVNLPNGGVYTGATTNTLQITGGTAAMDGYQYQCIVTGVCPPSVTTAPAVLTVNTLPAITSQPHDSTICDGSNAAFEVTATGTGISYQWQVNDGTGFINITNNSLYSGANAPILVLTGANAAMHNYQYHCIVSGTCTPPAISGVALLKVNTLPNVTTQPKDSTTCEWLDVAFEIAATGTGITYQWQLDNGGGFINVQNNSLYSGAATPKLKLTSVPFALDGYHFRCIVSGTCTPPDTSVAAMLHVNTSPVVIKHPSNAVICENTGTIFNVVCTGAGLTYQWQVNTGSGFTNLQNNAIYGGVTANVLSITGATASMHNYQYRCIVKGTCTPPDTSNAATLTIYTAPDITKQPVGVAICPRETTLFEVTATGTAITYQWQVNTGSGFTNTTDGITYNGSGTRLLYVLKTDKTMNNYQYRCIVSGTCIPEDTSAAAVLNIHPEAVPAIATDKPNATMCAGETMVLTGSPATGVTYQWQRDDVNIPGATSGIYTTMTGGEYKLIVNNGYCYTSSDSVNVVANPVPAADFYIPGVKVICPDSEVTLKAVNILAATYQWKYNGTNIPGAISGEYRTKVPGLYSLQVTNNYGCTSVSRSWDIIADPGPDPRITVSDIVMCTGNFKAYQWFRYSDSVLMATSACYSPRSNGVYSVFVTNDNGCSKMSDPYEMGRVGHDYVLISPNPTSDIIYVNTSLVVNIVLTTMDGKILLRQDRAKQIDLSSLPDGDYMLWVFDQQNEAVRAERVVKITGK